MITGFQKLFINLIFLIVVVSIVESDYDNQELCAEKNVDDKQTNFQSFVNSSINNNRHLLKSSTRDDYIFWASLSEHLLKSFNRYNYVPQHKQLQHLLKSSTKDNYIFWPHLANHHSKSSHRGNYVSWSKILLNLLKSSPEDNHIFWSYQANQSPKTFNKDNYVSRYKRSQHSLQSLSRENYIFWPSLSKHSRKSSYTDYYVDRLIPSHHLPPSSTRDNYLFQVWLLKNSLKSSNKNNYVSQPKSTQTLLQYSANDNVPPRLPPNFIKSLNRDNTSSSKQSKYSLTPLESYEECECGKSAVLEKNRLIIDGAVLKYMKMYPFMVSLHHKHRRRAWGYCGGSIISPTFIVTAGHCAVNLKFENCRRIKGVVPKCRTRPSDVLVGILGKNRRRPAYKVPVKRIIINPEYQMKGSLYDLALFELMRPLPCTDYSRPICLSTKELARPGEVINIVGAGGTKLGSRGTSREIHHGVTYVVDTSICDADDEPAIICVKGNYNGACKGDSGAAAFLDYQGRYFSVGLTSRDLSRSCDPRTPNMYTRLTYFYEFIAMHVKNLPRPKLHKVRQYSKTLIIGF